MSIQEIYQKLAEFHKWLTINMTGYRALCEDVIMVLESARSFLAMQKLSE